MSRFVPYSKLLPSAILGFPSSLEEDQCLEKVTNYWPWTLNLHNLCSTQCSCTQELEKQVTCTWKNFPHSKSRQLWQQNTIFKVSDISEKVTKIWKKVGYFVTLSELYNQSFEGVLISGVHKKYWNTNFWRFWLCCVVKTVRTHLWVGSFFHAVNDLWVRPLLSEDKLSKYSLF